MPSSVKDAAGNIFLLGNYFELGISPDGNFGTSDVPPAGYYTGVGETQVGMVYNPTGFSAAHNATNVDFFLPGTPLELFSVGYTHGGSTYVGTNYYIGSNKATPAGTGSLHQITNVSSTNTSTGNTLSATYVGLFNSDLQVTITYSFNVNDLYYSANVTLKNLGNTPMNDARYLRMVNPDNTTDYTGNYSTVNTIQSQQTGSGASLVLAQNPTPDAWQTATGGLPAIFGYYSTDPNTRVSILSGLPSTTNNAALNPFNSGFYATAPAVGTTTTANDTIVIDYDAGTLAAGASKSFNYSSLLTNNVAATIAAINSNTAPTFTGGVNTGLTLSQNSAITTITNTLLKVVDAEQGATLLTYTITTAPIKGTLTRSGVALVANSTFTQSDIDNGLIQYTPTSGVNGTDNLIFSVSDGAGGLLSAQTFAINITASAPVVVNNPPVAVDDTGSATEASGNNNSENINPATGNVLLNDADVDGRALTVSAIRTGNVEGSGTLGTVGQAITGNYGSLTLNANGSYTYVVNDSNSTVQALKLGETLTDSFNYTVYDSLLSDMGVLTITLNGGNDSPTVTNLNGDSSLFLLGSSVPVLLDVGQNAVVSDVDTTNYDNSILSISFAAGSLGSGVFSVDGTLVQSGNDSTVNVGELISVSNIIIGTVTANSKVSNGLAILLNANATATLVQTLLQNIYYIENSNDTTGTGDRIFNIQINEPNTTAMTPAVVKLTEKIPVSTLSLAIDTGVSVSDAITNSGVVNVSGVASNATWQYSLNNGTTWTTGIGSNFTITGDGNKSVIVRQMDALGNLGLNSNALVFTLDTTINMPNLTLVNDTGSANNDSITQNGSVTVSNLETGASWQYSQDGGLTWTTGSGSSLNLSGDGTKALLVRQTDVAGNTSPSNTLTFTLDTTVNTPTVTLTNDTGSANNDGITQDGSVTVSNLEIGASWQYSQDGGLTWTTGSGSSLTLMGDGTKSLLVRQTDIAGNTSPSSSVLTFTLDTTVNTPSLTLTNDTGSANNDSITQDGSITVNNLETGASWQYSQDGGLTWTAGSGSSLNLSGDGTKSLLVRQTDVAGNTSLSSALTFTLDSTVNTPVLTLTNDTGSATNDSITQDGSVTVSNLETGASWQYSQNGGLTWTTGSGSSLNLSGDGIKSLLVRQTDVAGNTSLSSPLTFTLDTTVNTPLLTLSNDTGSASNDGITQNGTVNVGNLETGATWQYSQNGGLTWTTGSGSSLTLTGDGTKSLLVRQTDIAGNTSANKNLTFKLDSTVYTPVLALVNDTGRSNTDGITRDGSISIANLESGATWQYTLNGGINWTTGNGSSFTLTGDGYKSVMVRQTDLAGNTSLNSSALTFTLKSTESTPILTLNNDTGSQTNDRITQDGVVLISDLTNAVSWQYSIDNGATWTVGNGDRFVLSGEGNKSVIAQKTDAAGNTSTSDALNFVLDTHATTLGVALNNDTGKNNDNITSDGKIIISGIENGASWRYSLNNGLTWTNGSGMSFSIIDDGDKSILVEQTDVAGNKSSQSVFNFTLDSHVLAPVLELVEDTGFSITDKITRNASVNVNGLENGASWEYSVDNGKNWIAGNATRFTLTGEGYKSVIARQTDVAGNISANSLPLNFVFDQSVSVPVLTLNNDTRNAFDGITSDGTVNVSNLETNAIWEYSTDKGFTWQLGSGSSFKLTGDGDKSVIVRQTDGAGNISSNSLNLTFTLDSLALPPELFLLNDTGNSDRDAITREGKVGVSNLENGASWQYSQDGGLNWITGQGDSFTIMNDGYKSIIVRQTDIAGNSSANSSELNFVLDSSVIAPVLALMGDTGYSNTDAITSNGTITVLGIENDASWQYSTDNGTNWQIGQGNSFTLTGDGYKSAIVRQTDLAGNSSTNSSPLNFILDSFAVTPTVTLINDTGNSSTDAITSDSRINISNLENGATWQYSIDNGVNWITGNGNVFTLAGDGVKSVITRQIDVAGNISPNSLPFTFALDTTIKTPQLALTNDTGTSNKDGITHDGSISVSNLENGATWQYSQDGGLNWITGNGNAFTLFGEGKKSVIVRQTDVAGNVSLNSSVLTFNLQNSVSSPLLDLNSDTGSQANDRITRDGTVLISDLKDAVSWRYSTDNANTWTIGSDNNWTAGSSGSFILFGDGNKSVIAQKTDAAGNISTSNIFYFLLDTSATAPTLALKNDTGVVNDYITSDGTVLVYGIESGASWQYSQDNGTSWIEGSGSSFTLTGDGSKSVIVRQTDVAGNNSKNSQPFNFTLNSAAPSPTLKLEQDSGNSNTDKITNNGTVNVFGLEIGASWEYSQDNGVNWITGNGTSFTLTGDGHKSVIVRQTDISKNTSNNSAPLDFTLEQSVSVPVLTLDSDTGNSQSDKITNDSNVHISGLENGATWQYSNDAGKNWITANSSSFKLVGDGDKSIIARQIDVAGNISANSLPLNFTLNTLINAPVLALKNDTGIHNDKITSDGTVEIALLGKNTSWEYSLDNGVNWITGSGNSITFTGDGYKSIVARQTDIAGNVSATSAPLNFVLDSIAVTPTLTLKNDTGYSNTDKLTSDGTVVISELEMAASWQYSQDNGSTWKIGTGNTITLTGDGNKTLLVKETDVAGNISNPAKFDFTLRSIESKFNADVKNLIETDSILTTSGKLTGTNTDKVTITPQTATAGKYGTFEIDQTGNWHYVTRSPHNEFLQKNVYVDSFPVTTSDGQQTSVTINITGTKDLPIVIDDLTRRTIKQVITNGAPQNILYGQLGLQSAQGKNIVQNTDKSWTSLDLTPITFNLEKGQAAGKDTQGYKLLKMTLANGSSMTLNTWDGSYVYVSSTSSSTTDTIDSFTFNAYGTPFTLELNRYDFLDLDGIADNVETNLTELATAADTIKPAITGDFNNDGIADKFQGAVTDIAWISYEDFKAALDNKLSSPESVINIIVAADNSGKVDNTAQLSNIEVLPSDSAIVGGSKPQSKQITAPWDPLQFSVSAGGTSTGLKDIDSTRSGIQTFVLIDISRAGVSDFNGYMKYISAETINAYKAAGLPLITLDGEKLTSATQAGWYDYTQRAKGDDGAWFIKDTTGKITKIAMIITDNSFGDDNLAGNEITDPSLPIIANPPIVPTSPSDNTLKSDTDVLALSNEFNNLILQDTLIDKTQTKTELVDNPLLCLPEWSQKLLDIPAKISQIVTTTEKVVAPLNGTGNDLNNQITGNSADNILKGLEGADTLTGGDGADTFVYLNKSDSSATNFDVITDFNIAQGDKIDLRAVDANSNLAGNQAFTYLGTASFTKQAGQLHFDVVSHMLLGDTQGNGNADFAIQLSGISTLPAEALITK